MFHYYGSLKYLSRSAYGAVLPRHISFFFTHRHVSTNKVSFHVSSSLRMKKAALKWGFGGKEREGLILDLFNHDTMRNIFPTSNESFTLVKSSCEHSLQLCWLPEHLSAPRSLIQCHIAVNMLTHNQGFSIILQEILVSVLFYL